MKAEAMAEQAKGASPFNETDLADKAAAVTQKHGDQAYQDHQAGREQIRNDPRFENVEAYLERAERKYLSRTLGHEVKPAAELSKGEMASEARELHAHFQQLSERYEQARQTSERRSATRWRRWSIASAS
jgi:hypothetical protein